MKAINKYLPLILSVCLVTPFANDIFVPSFPEMMGVFATHRISLVMTVFLLGLGLSQLFYGPLLDRYGRKPVLVTGLSIFVIASFGVVCAQNFPQLLIGRFLQAIGACSTITCSLAIVRDSYAEERLVSVIAKLMAVVAICPTLAPLLGSILQRVGGWRSSFIFLLVLGVCYWLVIVFLFRETLAEKNWHALRPKHLLGNYLALIKTPQYRRFIFLSACSYAILFAYIAAAPLLFMRNFGFSELAFGMIFSANAAVLVIASLSAPRLVQRFSLEVVVFTGALIAGIGITATLLLNYYLTPSIYLLFFPMWVATVGFALIRPLASAGAVKAAPKAVTGSAIALVNLMSFSGGALSTALLAHIQQLTSVKFALLVIGFALAAIGLACQAYRCRPKYGKM